MKKVLFVAPRFHTNQVGIVKAIKSFGYEPIFDVLIKGKTENYSELTPNVIKESKFSIMLNKFLKSKKANKYYSFPSVINYIKRIKKLKPSIIIIRDPKRMFSLVATVSAKIAGVEKVVFYTQENIQTERNNISRTCGQFLYKKIFNAEWITPIGRQDTFIKRYLPFVVEVECDNNKVTHSSKNEIKLLTIGKYTGRKNIRLLIDSINSIRKGTDKNVTLTVIGEVSTKEHKDFKVKLEKYTKASGLDNNVSFLENVEHEMIEKYYRNSDVFVLPASNEPAAISVLEAMAYGVPAVAAHTCGTSSYILEGLTGSIFQEENLDSLISSLITVIASLEHGFNYRQQCISHAKNSFSSEKYMQIFNSNFSG